MLLTNKEDIISCISKYAMDRLVYKEMMEPLLYDRGDIWFIEDNGFACVNSNKLKYLYTDINSRCAGVATKILTEIDRYGFTELNAITPIRNERFYLKRGWSIEKRFINYLKITKHYGFIQ